MKKLDTKRAVRLAFAPIACAALLTACAPLEPYDTGYGGSPVYGASTPISHFDRLDTNRDGFLSRGELEAAGITFRAAGPVETAEAAFHRLDVNRDGFLSRSEVEGTLAGIPGASFDASDSNRDGFLSMTEAMPHLRWLESRNTGGSNSFEALDRDRDGFLTRAEADPLLRSAQFVGGRYVFAPVAGSTAASFDQLDTNRDGFLSRIEASTIANPPTFDRFDTNRDGFLSRSEADAMFRSGIGSTPGAYGGAVYGPR